jgi:hypothetical protein
MARRAGILPYLALPAGVVVVVGMQKLAVY